MPLVSLAAASNELPEKDRGLEALWDRFVLRVFVNPVENENDFFKVVDDGNNELKATAGQAADFLQISDVESWQTEINKVTLSDEAKEVISAVRKELALLNKDENHKDGEAYYVSERRWKKIVHILKTSAFLNGRDAVDLMDCSLIEYAIWNTDKQHDEVGGIIEKILKQYGISFDNVELDKVKDRYSSERKVPQASVATEKVQPNYSAPKANISTEMIAVDGGTFERHGYDITVSSFEIGKYPVTQKLYQSIMGRNPSYFEGENRPVEQVSWYDAVEFCNKLSKKDGLTPCYSGSGTNTKCDFSADGYRLPTEAEWEFAARGGNNSNSHEYSGSDDLDEVGWYNCNSEGQTHDVGQKEPNELGIYDMSGNVWEWCNDWYDDYPDSDETDPFGASSGNRRVCRGGSWDDSDDYCAVSFRNYDDPDSCYSNVGFRVVRSSSKK